MDGAEVHAIGADYPPAPPSPTRASQAKGRPRGNAEQHNGHCSAGPLRWQVMLCGVSAEIRRLGLALRGVRGGEAGGRDLPGSSPDPLYVHTARRTTGAGSRV